MVNETIIEEEEATKFLGMRLDRGLTWNDNIEIAFGELGLLTLPSLYILDVVLYYRFKCVSLRSSDIHQYGTRGRDNFRMAQHRTTVFERLHFTQLTSLRWVAGIVFTNIKKIIPTPLLISKKIRPLSRKRRQVSRAQKAFHHLFVPRTNQCLCSSTTQVEEPLTHPTLILGNTSTSASVLVFC
ncbi:hypothetical protein J6590_094651 [Homalodisca vitripennis]|nr:hypothetical protein J6590_094651 [Homalodisca vitripennis]